MALSDQASWVTFLTQAGIPSAEAKNYATTFVENRIIDPLDLSRELLKDLGVKIIGDIIAILKQAQERKPQAVPSKSVPTMHHHRPKVDLPRLKADVTHPEFRKFKIDWDVYKQISQVPTEQIAAQLYTACDSSVQTAIINSSDNFFTLDETAIMLLLEKIVTRRSNPAIHRLTFSNLSQSDNEPIQDFLIRLKSAAKDCEFECPSCHHDLSPINIKDQFIRGLSNSTLQTDILAKSSTLRSLEAIVKHAEAFETALRDQSKLHDSNTSEVMKARLSDYMRQNRFAHQQKAPHQDSPNPKSSHQQQQERKSVPRQSPSQRSNTCPGCGSTSHGRFNRASTCPAWGKTCLHCNTPNHFAKVCRQKQRAVMEITSEDDIIAHVHLIDDSYTTVSAVNDVQLIPAELTPTSPNLRRSLKPCTVLIFPDSGASICLAGPQHLRTIGIHEKHLTPCSKKVTAVGGSTLTCRGWIEIQFKVGSKITRQPLYVCDKIDRIYFSREGCTEVNILPSSFPYPMTENMLQPSISAISSPHSITARPITLPYPANEESVPKLKEHLIKSFPSVFTKSTPFQAMHCKPVHIHLKKDATPSATHVPIPIPIHWKDEIKAQLDKDVENGVIEPVPVGEPVTWCSPMVVIPKKNGQPRRTVDLQKLNAHCLRETHHCESPFKLACQVPPNTKKTVIDASDGYHSILLDETSRPLTTFITEWGRYRYLRLPQGFVAAGDAYTRRYDEIIKDVKNKIKCIDDTLLYDKDITTSFFQTWEYLTLCAKNGITLNSSKFQFCQDTVEFAGLKLTPSGICPSDKVISAIQNFPVPKDITGARSWFGLVNQVAWAYANTPIMQPFRDLVKPNSTFYWDETLNKLFEESKRKIILQSIEGIKTFDTDRNTCLQTDWSRDGIGYLLLQQYCSCSNSKAPTCCRDGWKLVFAGSRFTKGAEVRYSPTEGEALAVAWALEHSKMFTLGCMKLSVSTDHKPLLGILKDRNLGSIANPRIANLKQRTLPYHFTVHYNPGKWHRAPDALSRNPASTSTVHAIYAVADDTTQPDIPDVRVEAIFQALCSSVDANRDSNMTWSVSELERAALADPSYKTLISATQSGFPKSRGPLDPSLKPYWNVRDRLSPHGNIVMMDDKLVVPPACRAKILKSLHAAHQGVSSMLRRADQTIYWPGMTADIRNVRYSCQSCNERAPSQPREPYCMSPPPLYPFQQICMDYFEVGHHSYMSCVDRFSGWIIVYHFPQKATSSKLISKCRNLFTAYGVSEEISSDGGPQFTSSEFQNFLQQWGVRHRLSSANYPQSNGRAELGVKSAKRIILNNTQPNGSLNNNDAARAILQYRNTPLPELGLSPAQLLFHRQLRDCIPSHPKHYQLHKEWIISAEQRERMYASRNKSLQTTYNAHTRPLSPLTARMRVQVQEKGKWNKSGRIIEILPNRQYQVRMDGSGRLSLRNRRFLKPMPVNENILPAPVPSAGIPGDSTPPSLPNDETTPQPDLDPGPVNTDPPRPPLSEETNETQTQAQNNSRALQRLADYNKKGHKESAGELPSRLRPRE